MKETSFRTISSFYTSADHFHQQKPFFIPAECLPTHATVLFHAFRSDIIDFRLLTPNCSVPSLSLVFWTLAYLHFCLYLLSLILPHSVCKKHLSYLLTYYVIGDVLRWPPGPSLQVTSWGEVVCRFNSPETMQPSPPESKEARSGYESDTSSEESLHSDNLDEEFHSASLGKRRRLPGPSTHTKRGKVASLEKQGTKRRTREKKKRKTQEGSEEEVSDIDLKDGQEVVGKVVQAPKTGWGELQLLSVRLPCH